MMCLPDHNKDGYKKPCRGKTRDRYNNIKRKTAVVMLTVLLVTTVSCSDRIVINFEHEPVNGGVSITKYIGSSAEVLIPDSIDGQPVVSIGERAFYNNRDILSVTIPDNVTSIGNEAFKECLHLERIVMGDGVRSIGNEAFRECIYLESVFMGNHVMSIGDRAFQDCKSLVNIIIPDSVTSIGEWAFAFCDGEPRSGIGDPIGSGLIKATIGDGVTSIGRAAFSGCGSLASLALGNSITDIGSGAFSGCVSLLRVLLPDSLASIEMMEVSGVELGAFSGCPGLAVNYKGKIYESSILGEWMDVSIGMGGSAASLGSQRSQYDLPKAFYNAVNGK